MKRRSILRRCRRAAPPGYLFDPDQVDESLPVICHGAVSLVWHRTPGYDGKSSCGSVWWLGNTGWRVTHCGHPTALFPWAGFDPSGRMIVAPNGRGFTTVAECRSVILDLYLQSETVMHRCTSARDPPRAA